MVQGRLGHGHILNSVLLCDQPSSISSVIEQLTELDI